MSFPPSVPPHNRSHSGPQPQPSSLPDKSNLSADAGLETVLDAALYAALQQGDAEALGELYSRHAGLVYGISLEVLGQAQAAADLTQDIFLTLIKPDGYDAERGTLRTYLAILTRSRALNRLRSKGIAAQSKTPAEQTTTIQTAMAQLSTHEQQILRMMYFEGLSPTAIARSAAELCKDSL